MTDRDASLDDWLEGIDLSENAPEDAEVLTDGPLDIRALLMRRFTWDTMACGRVEALLPKLGLTLSSPEGTEHEHIESHERMAAVYPFESMLQQFAPVLSTVLSTAMLDASPTTATMSAEDQVTYAEQVAEIILHSSRATLAQLFFMGLIGYGPMIEIKMGHIDPDTGDVVLDEDAEPGSE